MNKYGIQFYNSSQSHTFMIYANSSAEALMKTKLKVYEKYNYSNETQQKKTSYTSYGSYRIFSIEEDCQLSQAHDTISLLNNTEDESMEELYNFMIWGDYNKRMEELSTMALPEQWSFTGKNDYGILKNYLKYTYWKLRKESKVIENDEYCLFNTGLFTTYYEAIYIYGESNTNDEPGWKFKGFLTEFDLGALGIADYPERADYFSDPSLLVFDWHCKINVKYRHILEDEENRNRLPQNIIDSDTPLETLKGVIDTAIKKVMANYKLAVPHYYKNQIQLMIPLYFGKSEKPDLALVLSKMPKGYYQAHTCLTMDMAYLDARLITKPESNWLIP